LFQFVLGFQPALLGGADVPGQLGLALDQGFQQGRVRVGVEAGVGEALLQQLQFALPGGQAFLQGVDFL